MINRDELGILIVEPSDTYQRILKTLLGRLGFDKVKLVHNPMKARVLLQHDKSINVVLAELMLPDPAHGVDFVRVLRNRFGSEELPVLMMTNLSEKNYVEEAIKAGINGYLIKPIDPDHLEAHLWRLFDLPLRGAQRMGEFLVKRGVLTSEQRDIALKFQKEYTANLGAIALALGYIEAPQLIDDVLWQDDDALFFEKAAVWGLTEPQIDHLRSINNRRHLRFGDILVAFGYVEKEALEQALQSFKTAAANASDH
jgi:CheY-like chemotaxis protein